MKPGSILNSALRNLNTGKSAAQQASTVAPPEVQAMQSAARMATPPGGQLFTPPAPQPPAPAPEVEEEVVVDTGEKDAEIAKLKADLEVERQKAQEQKSLSTIQQAHDKSMAEIEKQKAMVKADKDSLTQEKNFVSQGILQQIQQAEMQRKQLEDAAKAKGVEAQEASKRVDESVKQLDQVHKQIDSESKNADKLHKENIAAQQAAYKRKQDEQKEWADNLSRALLKGASQGSSTTMKAPTTPTTTTPTSPVTPKSPAPVAKNVTTPTSPVAPQAAAPKPKTPSVSAASVPKLPTAPQQPAPAAARPTSMKDIAAANPPAQQETAEQAKARQYAAERAAIRKYQLENTLPAYVPTNANLTQLAASKAQMMSDLYAAEQRGDVARANSLRAAMQEVGTRRDSRFDRLAMNRLRDNSMDAKNEIAAYNSFIRDPSTGNRDASNFAGRALHGIVDFFGGSKNYARSLYDERSQFQQVADQSRDEQSAEAAGSDNALESAGKFLFNNTLGGGLGWAANQLRNWRQRDDLAADYGVTRNAFGLTGNQAAQEAYHNMSNRLGYGSRFSGMGMMADALAGTGDVAQEAALWAAGGAAGKGLKFLGKGVNALRGGASAAAPARFGPRLAKYPANDLMPDLANALRLGTSPSTLAKVRASLDPMLRNMTRGNFNSAATLGTPLIGAGAHIASRPTTVSQAQQQEQALQNAYSGDTQWMPEGAVGNPFTYKQATMQGLIDGIQGPLGNVQGALGSFGSLFGTGAPTAQQGLYATQRNIGSRAMQKNNWLGATMQFASPFVSAFTGGAVQLTPHGQRPTAKPRGFTGYANLADTRGDTRFKSPIPDPKKLLLNQAVNHNPFEKI